MAEVAYATSPALLGAARLLYSIKVNHGNDWLEPWFVINFWIRLNGYADDIH
jgi:hypothetical protein